MLEWKKLSRSYRLIKNCLELDVWEVAGDGWRFTIMWHGQYHGHGHGFATLDEACEAAMRKAKI